MIVPINQADVAEIAGKMRDIDRREITALAATNDPVLATAHLSLIEHVGATVWRGGEPVCAVGAMILWPGLASMFMFGTERFNEVKIEATRYVKHELLPTLRLMGCHRLQCHSIAEHTEAHEWIRYIGADSEFIEPEYGKNREDFVLFVMSRAALERVTSVGN